MPLVEIKVFEDELTDQETQALIRGVTDSIVSVSGEALRPHTWVIVNQVRSGDWGIAGDALGLKDVRALQARSDSSTSISSPASPRDDSDGAFVEQSGRNRWQPVANGKAQKTARTSENRCHGCPQLP